MAEATLSVSLKEEFNAEQCLDVSARIRSLKGVLRASFMPLGCFGIDTHRMLVTHDDREDVAAEIARMPEVAAVARL